MLDWLYGIGSYALFILLPLMAILGAHLALADYLSKRRAGRQRVFWLAVLSGGMSVVWAIVVYPLTFVEALGAGEAGAGLPTRPYEALRGLFVFNRTVGLPYTMCDVLPGVAKLLPHSICGIGGLGALAGGLFLLSLLTLLPSLWKRRALISVWVSLAVVLSLYSWQAGDLGEVLPLARAVPLYPRAWQVEYRAESLGAQANLLILFHTDSSAEVVQTYYQNVLPTKGWQRTPGPVPLEFVRPPEEGDPRSVAVVTQANRAGGETQVELTIKEASNR